MERNIRPELGQLAGHSDKEVPSLEVRITLQLNLVEVLLAHFRG